MVVNTTGQCIDAIKEFWQQKRVEVLARLKEKDHVIVLARASCRTPSSKTYKSMYADLLIQFSGLCLQHFLSKSDGISLQ
eukprot:superscaffoldBa00000167_g2362